MRFLFITEGLNAFPDRVRDLGCPACVRPPNGELVTDQRDRWWHADCAAAVLGQHTRHNEQRGEPGGAYHYTWDTPASPASLDPKDKHVWSDDKVLALREERDALLARVKSLLEDACACPNVDVLGHLIGCPRRAM